MANKVLLADGVSHLWLANGSDFLLLALSDSVAVQSTPFVNVPTKRRPFLGRIHISQTRGTDDFHGLTKRGGGLTGFLRRSRVSHPLAPVTHRTHTSADTGGGGGALDWVPANAKIFIDLVNNRAWTEADGIVAIDTLLGSDPNTVNGWNNSAYDLTKLTADGYVDNGDAVPIAFVAGALSKVLGSFTMRMQTKQVSGTTGLDQFAIMSADGTNVIELYDTAGLTVKFDSFTGALLGETTAILNSGNGSLDVYAFTIDGARFDLAVNGSSPVTGTIGDDDRPSGNPLVAGIVIAQARALQTITIYDALPDTTGLSALSQ